jgi:general secretion pathway protein L
MLSDLFDWWSQQMFDLIPGPLRRRDTTGPNPLIVVASPRESPSVRFVRRHGEGERALGEVTLDSAGIPVVQALVARLRERRAVVRLPAEYLLERRVTLPLAAEMALETVLRTEMDRLTPFAATDLYWSWRMLKRDRPHGRIHIQLTLVLRSAIRPTVAALRRAGILPVMLEIATGAGPRRMLLGRPGRPRRSSVVAVTTAYCLMAAAGIAVPFIHQSLARSEVEATIAKLQPQVAEAEALRRRIAGSGTDAFAQAEARAGNALEALAAVTELLPGDTYLTDFAMRQRRLVMSGQSAAAARLIGLLIEDPRVRNPAFNAPVTRSQNDARELFSIQAEYVSR